MNIFQNDISLLYLFYDDDEELNESHFCTQSANVFMRASR